MYGVHELGHFLLAGLMPALSRDQGTLVPVFLRGEREPQGTSFLTLSGLRNRGCRPSSPGQRLGAGFPGPSGGGFRHIVLLAISRRGPPLTAWAVESTLPKQLLRDNRANDRRSNYTVSPRRGARTLRYTRSRSRRPSRRQ